MKRFVRRAILKLQNTPKLTVLTSLGILATVGIMVVGTGNAHARYLRQKQALIKPRVVQQATKNTEPNKPQATTNLNKKTSKIANKPSSNDLKNCLQARTEIVPREKAMTDEQKRHFNKLKEIQTTLQKSGNANPEGYKQELAKENDLNRQKIQGIMKSQTKNTKPEGC